ncbi:MAG: hypothetical protein KA201_24075, partial [Kofleriaceae bacterium]|nr:hypothetical protein [Kofleriaceae bacterium]
PKSGDQLGFTPGNRAWRVDAENASSQYLQKGLRRSRFPSSRISPYARRSELATGNFVAARAAILVEESGGDRACDRAYQCAWRRV